MDRFEHDGVSLAYDDTSETDLPTVVFIHGLSSARSTWAGIAPRVGGRHRVVTIDQRGHGESSHAAADTYTLDHYGPDAVAFCEQVVGQPAVLVGHSLGGVVASYVASRRPDLVRGVFLEDPPLYVGERGDTPREGVAAFFPMMRAMLRDLRDKGASVDEYIAVLRVTPALNGKGTMAEVMGDAATVAMAQGWAGLDPEVFTPVIAGVGLADWAPAERLPCEATVLRADPAHGPAFTEDDEKSFLAAHPHATVTVVEGASHAIHDEQPDRFVAELEALLAATPERTRR